MRYFVHRDARLPGEISRLLASALTDFYRRRAVAPKDAAPAQLHVLQRFGSSVNLHLHDHAVVSDGAFSLDNGVLRFHGAPPPTFKEVAELVELLRRRILKRMLRMRVLPEATVSEMLAWPHGGFSLDGGTYVEASDAGMGGVFEEGVRGVSGAVRVKCGGEMKLVGGDFRRPGARPDIGASRMAGGFPEDESRALSPGSRGRSRRLRPGRPGFRAMGRSPGLAGRRLARVSESARSRPDESILARGLGNTATSSGARKKRP
ncbi:MAG: transposase [Elusimicrobiota bacterium]|nr:transposase [Elusimicrobiota bacterium]